MQYKIVEHHIKKEFEKLINEALDAGWTLSGNLCVCVFDECFYYTQAMVKNK